MRRCSDNQLQQTWKRTAAATSAQLPPLSHPDILITEGYELKTPKETLPSSTKSSEDKSKDKPSIILTLWAEIGWTPEEPGSYSRAGDGDPVSPPFPCTATRAMLLMHHSGALFPAAPVLPQQCQ